MAPISEPRAAAYTCERIPKDEGEAFVVIRGPKHAQARFLAENPDNSARLLLACASLCDELNREHFLRQHDGPAHRRFRKFQRNRRRGRGAKKAPAPAVARIGGVA